MLQHQGSDGGERGIRTLGAAFDSTHDFQSCSFSQLGHLSIQALPIDLPVSATTIRLTRSRRGVIGGEGGIRTHDPVFDRIPLFESGAFNRSATSPVGLPVNRAGIIRVSGSSVNVYEGE